MRELRRVAATLLALVAGCSAGAAPGHWPQWRGPARDNVSTETGLLPVWPAQGPPLSWEADGLGEGNASVAVAGGRVFTLGDLFGADLSTASVVAVYLPESFLERLKPQFARLKPGARIVSHQFLIPGVKPDLTVTLESPEDGALHAVHLWTAPLGRE